MTTRRKFMKVVGGGFVFAAAGAALWAATREPVSALHPWTKASRENETDHRRRALSYAVLAPNPHNRQPWVADLSTPDEITLLCDLDRRLPSTDPYDRQITIGLGCFIELLVQASADDGFRTELTLFPEGEPQPRLNDRPVAHIRFTKDETSVREPLFTEVLNRRSNKEPYDTARPVAETDLKEIAAVAQRCRVAFTNDAERVVSLRARAWDAMDTEITTYATMKESVDLMRIGRAEIEANPDGIDVGGALVEGVATLGWFRKEDLLDPTSSTFRQQMPMLKAPFDTAMAFIWLTTPSNARTVQIGAGRDYIRLNLAATSIGIGMHPLSQALQEFDEMRPHFEAIRRALRIAERDTLQMFARLGYGPDVKARPRWPFQTRIKGS